MECAVSLAKPSAVSWYEIPWWAGIQTSTILTIIFDSKSSICINLFHNCNHAVTDLLITMSIATVQSQKIYADSLCCLYLQNLKWFTESSSPNTIPSNCTRHRSDSLPNSFSVMLFVLISKNSQCIGTKTAALAPQPTDPSYTDPSVKKQLTDTGYIQQRYWLHQQLFASQTETSYWIQSCHLKQPSAALPWQVWSWWHLIHFPHWKEKFMISSLSAHNLLYRCELSYEILIQLFYIPLRTSRDCGWTW